MYSYQEYYHVVLHIVRTGSIMDFVNFNHIIKVVCWASAKLLYTCEWWLMPAIPTPVKIRYSRRILLQAVSGQPRPHRQFQASVLTHRDTLSPSLRWEKQNKTKNKLHMNNFGNMQSCIFHWMCPLDSALSYLLESLMIT